MTSIVEVYRQWPTKDDRIAHLEKIRWRKPRPSVLRRRSRLPEPGHDRCALEMPAVQAVVRRHRGRDIPQYARRFTALALLISLRLSARKGLSAMQAARDLEMRRPMVWSMMHRIRKSMADKGGELLRGIVEMDEAYVGGKPRRKNRRSDDPPGGQGQTTKEPIVGAVERGGKVKTRPIAPAELTGNDRAAFFRETVNPRRARC